MADTIHGGFPGANSPIYRRGGTLEFGVEYGGVTHKDFVVGPLTADALTAAEATMPRWIDQGAIRDLAIFEMPDEQRENLHLAKPEMSPDQIAKAKSAAEARYDHHAKYRIERLGEIPLPDIPEAVGKLIPSDWQIILRAALQVEELLDDIRKRRLVEGMEQ